ncbi:MAG: hypothetical protein V3S46_05715, partial [Nitrospinota bacterium]
IQKCLPGFGAKAVYCGTTQAETTFAQSAPRTLASHFFKFPFRALTTLGVSPRTAVKMWPFIGGCEALVEITPAPRL